MQIKVERDDLLILQDPSRRIAGWGILAVSLVWLIIVVPLAIAQNGILAGLIGVIGSGMFALWAVLILRRSQALFDAKSCCLQVRRGGSGSAKWTIPFDEIEQVYLLRSQGDDGGPPGFLLNVGTSKGDVQLSLTVLARPDADAALDAAASFLKRHNVHFTVPPKPKRWPARVTRPTGNGT